MKPLKKKSLPKKSKLLYCVSGHDSRSPLGDSRGRSP